MHEFSIDSSFNDDLITKFENKVFSSFETVNKMIFYIQNNFALDDKLERFYQQFGFKMEKSIDKFIDYLVKLN